MLLKRRLSILLLLSVICVVSKAQRVDEESMNKARDLKKTYPNDEAVLMKSTSNYTFDLDESKDQAVVQAHHNLQNEYVTLKDNLAILFTVGVNSFCSVDDIYGGELKGDKIKKARLKVNERDYQSAEIFDDDSKMKYLILPMATLGQQYGAVYEKTYSDVRYLTSDYFADNYPV